MAATRDDCFACGKLVPRHEGAAFRDGRIVDLRCYVDGAASGDPTRPSAVPPNQRLLGVHVLVVDDSDSTIKMLRAALEYCGAFVSTAQNAIEGQAILLEVRPHVLVSDIAMPNDGLAMVRQVLVFAADTGVIIPAIAISAGGDGRDGLREAGFAAVIPKPLDPFVLADLVAKLHRDVRMGSLAGGHARTESLSSSFTRAP